MQVELMRAISNRCFVARRMDVPAVFLVELSCPPRAFLADSLPVRVELRLSEFDWKRKAFTASEV